MDFESAMETFAEAYYKAMAAQVSGKIVMGNNNNISSNSGHVQVGSSTGRDTPIESPLQQQLGSNVDYGKMPSCMDLSSSSCTTGGTTTTTATVTTTLSPVKRLKGVGGSRSNNSASSPSSSSATCTNIPPTLGKSIPIHCIIEVSNGSNNNNNTSNNNGNNRRLGDSMVETTTTTTGVASNNNNINSSSSTLDIINNLNNNNKDSPSSSTSSGKVVVEVDDFVIIPAGTPFHEVVTTVLTLLGYPKDIIRQAEGTICLRNWKPLRLDQVCDSSVKTVGDILNDLTNHATLRVLVTRAKGGTTEDLKEKLLRLLLAHSSSLLMGAGCPLDEMTMNQLVKGQWPQNLAEDVKRRFNQWYKSLHPGTTLGLLESLQHTHLQQQQQQVTNNSNSHQGNLIASNHVGVGSIHHHLVNGSTGHHHHHHANDLSTKTAPFIDEDQNHPVFHGLTTQKTRMRTSFDPEMELPKLQQWFAENPHPSRHQIQQYVRELNSLDCRKDRKPLDVNNVIYWFKNARAAQKRNEIRYNGLSPSHPPSYGHHHHHHHHHSQLNVGSHHHLISHSHGEGRRSEGGGIGNVASQQQALVDMTNGDSGNDHSGDSEDYQDAEVSKDNVEDRERLLDVKENDRMLRSIKEERDDDYINVDVDNNGGGGHNGEDGDGVGMTSPSTSPRASPREVKNIIITSTNNNEEPKDLSSSGGKSPHQVDSGEDTFDEKPKLSSPHDKDHHQHQHHGTSVDGKGKRVSEKSQVITADDNGVDMIRTTDLELNDNTSCSSVSPRSSPGGLSPSPHYDFNGPPSMSTLGRFHPFFDHPSFMAYRHFNSFNFASNYPGGGNGGTNGSDSYEAALNVTRKSLLPLGKPSSSSSALDIFHEFPQGLNPSTMVVAANGRNGGGVISTGVNCDALSRLRAEELFPPRPASSADIISSIINSNRADFSPLNLGNHHHSHHHHHNSPNSTLDERRKRNRTFIDPVTEVVLLENWFKVQTHPSHNLILKYTEQLNNMPYRQKFPKLEPKNIQFWFKNRRAKCKRLKMTL